MICMETWLDVDFHECEYKKCYKTKSSCVAVGAEFAASAEYCIVLYAMQVFAQMPVSLSSTPVEVEDKRVCVLCVRRA